MRKGQAALEFLTTYGWAFLVILVMIGALAGFGILSPKNLLPNRCNIGPELSCEEAQIDATGNLVTIVVRNNMADSINIDAPDIVVSYETEQVHIADCTIDSGVTASLPPGTTAIIECAYDTAATALPPVEDKAKLAIVIAYTPVGKTLSQQVKGELFQSVI